MPIEEKKTDTQDEQTIERTLHSERYSLTLGKKLCKGCEICSKICPREAIKPIKTPKAKGEKAKPPTIDFNEQKCSHYGMCEPVCPFSASKVRGNDQRIVLLAEKNR